MRVKSESPQHRRSLVEFLLELERHAGDVAFTQREGYRSVRWSYRELAGAARQFARELEARGVGAGDRVVLWGKNSAEWVAAFWGCVLRGAVVVPMDEVASADFAQRVAQQVEPRLLAGSREQAQLDPTLPALPLEGLRELLAQRSAAPYASLGLDRSATAEIVFTSGTTAEPKGVVITHGNILANLEPLETESQKYLGYERFFHPLRFLNLLPLSHVFGQFLAIFIPPLFGATVVFAESLNPAELMRTIRRERISVLITVPRLLETLREKLERDLEGAGQLAWLRQQMRAAEGDRFHWRIWRFRRIHRRFGWKFWAFISGGAALQAETENFWSTLGFAVIQGYGLTETTSLVSVNHPFRLARGAIGKVLPGREIKLDANGEILVRGESVAAAYWREQELTPVPGAVGDEGWFRTGDIGALDADGNLYFKGRKKNVIVTPEGMNVFPEDLEAALRRQPEVRDCVVVGLERNGNAEPCAVLLLRDPSSDPGGIVQRANESLAEYQRMRRWVIWPEEDFPRTATQKPRLPAVLEVVHARLGSRAPAAGESGGLASLIRQVTKQTSARLTSNAQLAADLNLSSIDRVELMSAIEDRYQVDLNESQFAAATTVGQLEQMLRQPQARRAEFHYSRWAQHWPVTWIRLGTYYLLVWPATMLLGKPRIRGRENLRGVRGPVVVVANHTTRSDIAFIQAALPLRLRHRLAVSMEAERLRAMRNPSAELNLFGRWLERVKYALVVALFNVFPLPQQSGFRESFQFAGELVDRGYSVVVFPEGQLTRDGQIGSFRAGIGLLVNGVRLPVVPIRVEGLFALKQARKRWARPGTIKVTVGPPVQFAAGEDPEQIATVLRDRVLALGGQNFPAPND
jgi:long-chain acyl-CoA synthetase